MGLAASATLIYLSMVWHDFMLTELNSNHAVVRQDTENMYCHGLAVVMDHTPYEYREKPPTNRCLAWIHTMATEVILAGYTKEIASRAELREVVRELGG